MRVISKKQNLLKDKQRRINMAELEKAMLILKVLSQAGSLITKDEKDKALTLLENYGRKASITRIRNRCLITARARAVIKNFGLSRLEFKRLASSGYLSGVKKAS